MLKRRGLGWSNSIRATDPLIRIIALSKFHRTASAYDPIDAALAVESVPAALILLHCNRNLPISFCPRTTV